MTQGPFAGDEPPAEDEPGDADTVRPLPLPEPPRDDPAGHTAGTGGWRPLLWALLGGAVGALVTFTLLDAGAPEHVVVPPEPAVAGNVAPVAEAVVPSIVTVLVDGGLGESSGSGVVYRPEGLIVTNDHVASAGNAIDVELSDGTRFEAELVGTDPLTDLALLRIPRRGLQPIATADYDGIRIGEPAVAVGNPLGLQGGPSVTAGVVSALDRTLQVAGDTILYGLIQTDAPITRGSSGGALVDARGALLGITTAIGVSDVGAEGLGFAVPVDMMLGVAGDLASDGEVRHAFLGIRAETAESISDQGGVAPTGAEITSFVEGSAIQQAGARVGDVITSLEGEPVGSIDELVSMLRRMRAGDEVIVTIRRDGSELRLQVTLGLRE